MKASATNRPKASRISSSPATLIGSWASPNSARINDTPPSVPGRIMPGLNSSSPIRIRPERQQQEHGVRVHEQLQRRELERHVRATRPGRRSSRASAPSGPCTRKPSSSRISACWSAATMSMRFRRSASVAVTFTASCTMLLRQVAVAAVALRERAHVGGGVVADLAPQHLVLLAAAERDRGRRADVRLRRHRRHVGGLGDVQRRRRRRGRRSGTRRRPRASARRGCP